jgi:hypothetical protein
MSDWELDNRFYYEAMAYVADALIRHLDAKMMEELEEMERAKGKYIRKQLLKEPPQQSGAENGKSTKRGGEDLDAR